MILCPKRNRATAQRGELEERDTCCEARDYTLVSHNSPVSQIPPGPHSHSLNARRRKRDMKGTACPGDDDRNMVFLLTQWCQQQAERGVGDGTNSGVTSKSRRNRAFLDLCSSASVWAHIPMCVKKCNGLKPERVWLQLLRWKAWQGAISSQHPLTVALVMLRR